MDEKYLANKTVNPENAVFYLDKWRGVFSNMSSVNGAPEFITKKHFYDCDPNLTSKIHWYVDAKKKQQLI